LSTSMARHIKQGKAYKKEPVSEELLNLDRPLLAH